MRTPCNAEKLVINFVVTSRGDQRSFLILSGETSTRRLMLIRLPNAVVRRLTTTTRLETATGLKIPEGLRPREGARRRSASLSTF